MGGFSIISILLRIGFVLNLDVGLFFSLQPQLMHGLFRYLRCRPLARGSVF